MFEARTQLAGVVQYRVAVQLGGAAGTLAALGERGPDVLREYAEQLHLAEPSLPWHTNRVRIGEIGSALALVSGAVAKIALDVTLLAQTEVAEVAEAAGGGSSTMPQKRNPVDSTIALACARQVEGHSAVLLGALVQEHERATGAWQAEWPALSGAIAYTGGAVAGVRRALEGLEVDTERMATNLDATGGLVMAERIAYLLAPKHGRQAAQDLVAAAARRTAESGHSFRDELLADPDVDLSANELDQALDPAGYLGAADALIDRALKIAREEII
jgi:3-carboxy-cis,cis-muconate cycloisomerase